MQDGDVRHQLLVSKIGSDLSASDDGAVPVWTAVKALQDEAKTTQAQLEEIKLLQIEPTDMAKESEPMSLNTELAKLASHCKLILENTTARITALETTNGLPNQPCTPNATFTTRAELQQLET